MKFAIAVLLATASAGQVQVVQDIKFNKEGLDNAASFR